MKATQRKDRLSRRHLSTKWIKGTLKWFLSRLNTLCNIKCTFSSPTQTRPPEESKCIDFTPADTFALPPYIEWKITSDRMNSILNCNRSFPSSSGSLFQNKGRCSAFDVEIILHSHANKTHFHKKGCVPSLILKVRVFGTRKCPISGRSPQ